MKKKFNFENLEKEILENIKKINDWRSENSYSQIKKKIKNFQELKESSPEKITVEDIEKNDFLQEQLFYLEDLEVNLHKNKKKIEKLIYKINKKIEDISISLLLIERKEEKYLTILESKDKLNQLNKDLENLLEEKNSLTSSLKKVNWKDSNVLIYRSKLNIINNKIKRLKKIIKEAEKITNEEDFEKYKQINQEKFSKKNIKESLKYDLTNESDNLIKLIDKIEQAVSKNKKDSNSKYIFKVENLNTYYGNSHSLKEININIPKNQIISIIGPSGCGKSTFLRTLNRINDETEGFKFEGKIIFNNEYDIVKLKSINNKYNKIDITELRSRVGMIFQQPNPFPMSVFKNVAYGPKINGIKNKFVLQQIVVDSLKDAALYDDVMNNLTALGTSLSGGQQQRLCIARAIANKPDVLLMDEPTSALDPISAAKIENLILKLKKDYTIIIVTHSMQQAARISDYTAFFYQGELIEFDRTKKMFTNPSDKKTEDYIRGKFG